ncbi:hypothetical protein LJC63_09980, partial [Ruminococcaceae bacterium OttesenSCG-928-L11]|nr:hypothetical protein [Ruminococcaceae bacterium OttesenSCG-928-L11]
MDKHIVHQVILDFEINSRFLFRRFNALLQWAAVGGGHKTGQCVALQTKAANRHRAGFDDDFSEPVDLRHQQRRYFLPDLSANKGN